MEFIIGGYLNKPKVTIHRAIDYFENRFSLTFDSKGILEGNYLMGIFKDF